MKMVVVVGPALALWLNRFRRRLNGRWWVQASQHDRLIYQMAFIDGGGTIGREAAIDRFYSNPQALDVSQEKGIRNIWGSADKLPAPSLK